MRPLGGLIFGDIGDKLGRKRALTVSVLVMAVPTFLIGLLPTYREMGVAAPLLLVLLRLVQGTSVGGEYTTSSIFLVEHAPAWRRGLLGSFAPFGSCTGILIGSAVGAILTTVPIPARSTPGDGVWPLSPASPSAASGLSCAATWPTTGWPRVACRRSPHRCARPSQPSGG